MTSHAPRRLVVVAYRGDRVLAAAACSQPMLDAVRRTMVRAHRGATLTVEELTAPSAAHARVKDLHAQRAAQRRAALAGPVA